MTEYRPKFLYRNKINDVSQISDSAGNADNIKRKLFDRNQGTQYVTVGETSGTSTITWTPVSAQTIGAILIQNCNWKTFTITYNSGTAFSFPIQVSGSSYKNFYFEFDEVSATSIVISITQTHTSGEVRKAGQIIFTSEIFEMASTYEDIIQPIPGGKSIIQEVSDGTYFKVFVRDNVNYDAVLNAVPYAERANFRTVYDLNKTQPFIFVLNAFLQEDLPDEAYIVDGDGNFLVDGDGNFIVSGANSEWDGLAGHYHWGTLWDFNEWYNNLEDNGYIGRFQLYQATGIG
jgi:hypothetical protein